MNSVRSPCSIAICLVLASACHWCSGSSRPSLWGKKVNFSGHKCLWQLDRECVVPALEELSACVLLRPLAKSPDWTGFVYKRARAGERPVELGLTGSKGQLVASLFGQEFSVKDELALESWHTVCITWSGPLRRLRLYVNGSSRLEASVNATLHRRLAQNGTLTLGEFHTLAEDGTLTVGSGRNFMGNMSLFRMWAQELTAEQLHRRSCADGDVVSWDARDWDYTGCSTQPDHVLACAWSMYRINMKTTIVQHNTHDKPLIKLENIIDKWLQSVFPSKISVHHIHVSSPSCRVDVSVNPENDVALVQASISEMLRPNFTWSHYILTADHSSLSVRPTDVTPTVTTSSPTVTNTTVGPPTTSGAVLPVISPTGAAFKDTFFRVQLCLNMTGETQTPQDTVMQWLQEKLTPYTMRVLNLNVFRINHMAEMTAVEMTPWLRQTEYNCSFHIQAIASRNTTETRYQIYSLLKSEHSDGRVTIQALPSEITHIEPGICPEDTTTSIYGEFIWTPAEPQEKIKSICKKNRSERAYRLCYLDAGTGKATWQEPDFSKCKPDFTFSDLDKVTVTANNSAEVVGIIEDLVNSELSPEGGLAPSDLITVVQKLCDVVGVSNVTHTLGSDIISIVGDLLGMRQSNLCPVSEGILNLTDSIGDKMFFPGESVNVTVPSLALSMVNVDPDQFHGLTFGVSSFSTGAVPEIFVNLSFVSEPLAGAVATIALPSSLQALLPQDHRTTHRVHFQFYGTPELFKDPKSNGTLNTYVVSASVNNSIISNLKQSVVMTFSHHKRKELGDTVRCVYWDFKNNGGQGGWNDSGCDTVIISEYRTSCHCNHLTHFGVLLDVSRTLGEVDSQILSLISYVGCGVSSIFLGVSLLTYAAFGKLRRDYPSKILMNLSGALLGLNLIFLLDSWLSSFNRYGLCIATAASLHYFLLASFTWMALEAVHMYFALVKVFNVYIPSYVLKFCTIGWGIPLVVVALVLAIEKDAYGDLSEEATEHLQHSGPFCWVQSDIVFYVAVVAFILLVLLMNVSVFVVVLVQIRHMGINKPAGNTHGLLHNLRAVASLTFLLGLTWIVNFFTWGPAKVPLLYVFAILNSLQGFFIFVFHCLMKENVRKQWRIHLCCGRFRLNDYLDWSRSVTLGDKTKQNQLVTSQSVRSMDTSFSRKISDSSSGSGPINHQEA